MTLELGDLAFFVLICIRGWQLLFSCFVLLIVNEILDHDT